LTLQAAQAARIINFRMGETKDAAPVKLIAGMLSAYPGAFADAESRLVQVLGEVDLRSDFFAHEFTEYYRGEMGHPLVRYFLSFTNLVSPDRLVTFKRLSNRIERDIAASGEWPVVRPVNVDPGLIAPDKLVLASTKDYGHRIYLGRGIYAEVTLQYRCRGPDKPGWVPLEWTYPDYRTSDYHEFFSRVRARLLEQRREARA